MKTVKECSLKYNSIVWAIVLLKSYLSNLQAPEGSIREFDVRGNISLSNNGFSNIPSFLLGKPATVVIYRQVKKDSVLNLNCGFRWKANLGHFYFGKGIRW